MQREERESWEHIHFAKYHLQEQGMLLKMCLRMKYVLQDLNQSLKIPHLEIQVNRTMLQKLSTNNVWNKPHHKDLWACKTGHSVLLEFLPSMFWWHLTPNRGVRCCTHVYPSPENWAQCSKEMHSSSRPSFPFPVQNLKAAQHTAPPRLCWEYITSTLSIMGRHNLGLTQLLKFNGQLHIDWAAYLDLQYTIYSYQLPSLETELYIRSCEGRRLRTPGAHPGERGGVMCEHTHS